MRIVITPKAVAPALAAILLTLLAACGTEDAAAPTGDGVATAPPSATPSTTSSGPSGDEPSRSQVAEPAPADLAVVVDGAEITPNAQEISVDVGDPLSVSVEADRAGELHVHSKPEQYFPFQPGETSFELTVQTPGSVEVEDDDTGDVVALLEVS
ncbi:hypothetical protein ENKNEFLB_01692 [Nocardioides aquaticus]|uniref:EfeO-type cupredoxin-like domain-containing protein n=1 Tax=Nocardioides aquaticus TaxID=160826 RepID=A0ABX8EFM2_9ACTN|nr:hypothetical protein [Nocardioides aquaticus]QVT79311.1 hypothetical protein ENKNEFLB_01692 [Nocardioides aquaticus]